MMNALDDDEIDLIGLTNVISGKKCNEMRFVQDLIHFAFITIKLIFKIYNFLLETFMRMPFHSKIT